jgi:hypothetical protein
MLLIPENYVIVVAIMKEEEAPECHTENQLGHFREFRGVTLHEFSTKIHDSIALCPVPIGRNPSKM